MEFKHKAVSPGSRIREKRMAALAAEERMQERMGRLLERRRHQLEIYIEKMRGLSPLEKLGRGYSYVEDQAGRNIRSVSQVQVGQIVGIRLGDGRMEARITEIGAAGAAREGQA